MSAKNTKNCRSCCSLSIGAATLALLAAALSGCASNSSQKTTEASPGAVGQSSEALEWKLTGSRIIGCCCATPCPCRINYKPMHCHGCDYTTAVHIDKGEIDGVKMDGMMWIITGCGFGQNIDNNWIHVYVSDKATDEQYAALKSMLDEGMRAVGDKAKYLGGKFVGMREAPMSWEVSSDKRQWSAKINGILEIKTRSIILPGHTEPARATGIFDDYGDHFIHADCLVHKYNDSQIGYSWDLAGRQCNQADFTLTSQRVAKGGIGWGCWSAHADIGNSGKYAEELVGHK